MKASKTFVRSLCVALSLAAIACGQNPVQESEATRLGQPLTFDGYELTIEAFSQPTEIGVFKQKPAEGGSFVAVTYSLRNVGEKPLDFLTRPKLRLLDPNGTLYEPEYGTSLQHANLKRLENKTAKDLNPGITLRDAAVWEIGSGKFDPKRWKIIIVGHEETPIVFQ